MEFWQPIFLNLAIVGFISQVIHIFVIFSNSKLSSKRDKAIYMLEKIYNKPSFSGKYIRNLKS